MMHTFAFLYFCARYLFALIAKKCREILVITCSNFFFFEDIRNNNPYFNKFNLESWEQSKKRAFEPRFAAIVYALCRRVMHFSRAYVAENIWSSFINFLIIKMKKKTRAEKQERIITSDGNEPTGFFAIIENLSL